MLYGVKIGITGELKIAGEYDIIKSDELIVFSYLHLSNNNGLSAIVSLQYKEVFEEERNMVSTFSNNWSKEHGYTYEEAELKKAKVDEAHGVGLPHSKWKESKIEPDPTKKDGYRVVIETISDD